MYTRACILFPLFSENAWYSVICYMSLSNWYSFRKWVSSVLEYYQYGHSGHFCILPLFRFILFDIFWPFSLMFKVSVYLKRPVFLNLAVCFFYFEKILVNVGINMIEFKPSLNKLNSQRLPHLCYFWLHNTFKGIRSILSGFFHMYVSKFKHKVNFTFNQNSHKR